MSYVVRNINQVPEDDRQHVMEECYRAARAGHLVSVQMDLFNGEPMLYGVYTNDAEWVEDYYRSGGMWEYVDPEGFLDG